MHQPERDVLSMPFWVAEKRIKQYQEYQRMVEEETKKETSKMKMKGK